MTVEEAALILSVVFAGLWSGLLLMLATVLHPMIRRMDGRGFALFLRAFLPVARRAPSNYIAVLPDDWPAVQAYYFRLNWIRAVITWTAFGLFLAALVALLD
jgi:hypothetical protein